MRSVFKGMIGVVLALLITATGCLAGAPPREFTKTIKKEFAITPAGTTTLSNKYGMINVQTWEQDRVKIAVNIVVNAANEAKAQEVFDRIAIDFSHNGDLVTAQTEIASRKNRWFVWNAGSDKSDYTINYEVFLPASNNLNVTHRYGDLYVAPMTGKVTLDVKYVNFKLENAGNGSQVDFAYGNGTIVQARDMRTSVSHGQLIIEESGDLNLESRYSKVIVDKANDLQCNSRYDNYEIGEIADFRNEGSYDDLRIKYARNVALASKYSNVNLGGIARSLRLDLDNGTAQARMQKNFTEAILNGAYTNFVIDVDQGADFRLDAAANYAGISYPSDLKVSFEREQASEHEVRGYRGGENAPVIKARLRYGGLKVRVE